MQFNENVMNTQDVDLFLSTLEERLNETEKRTLDEKGYVVLENVLDEPRLQRIRTAFEKVMKKEGFLTGRQIGDEETVSMGDLIAKQFTKEQEVYHDLPADHRVDNLINKHEAFDMIYIDVKSLAAVCYILGGKPFKLSSLEAIEALPGRDQQPLRSEETVICIWLLDDYSESSGTLKVIASDNPASGFAGNEVLVKGAAGSVCMIKPHMQFGETMNQTDSNRRALYCKFTVKTNKSEFNQLEYLRRSTYLRISPLAKNILNI
jgi:ectoine hydroxylase-related dioxygenase (phytanoyl-CoA dioxygenase family)